MRPPCHGRGLRDVLLGMVGSAALQQENNCAKGNSKLQDRPREAGVAELEKHRAGQLTDHLVVLIAVALQQRLLSIAMDIDLLWEACIKNHTRPCRPLRKSAAS